MKWIIRSATKKKQTTAPPWSAFLSKWCAYMPKWTTATHKFIIADQLTLFQHTLEVYLETSYIPPVSLSCDPLARLLRQHKQKQQTISCANCKCGGARNGASRALLKRFSYDFH